MFNVELAQAIQHKYVGFIMSRRDGPIRTVPYKAGLGATVQEFGEAVVENKKLLPPSVSLLFHEMDEYKAPVNLILTANDTLSACFAIPIHKEIDSKNQILYGKSHIVHAGFPTDALKGIRHALETAEDDSLLPHTILITAPYRRMTMWNIPTSVIERSRLERANPTLFNELSKITGIS